jgi:hypothetical protein
MVGVGYFASLQPLKCDITQIITGGLLNISAQGNLMCPGSSRGNIASPRKNTFNTSPDLNGCDLFHHTLSKLSVRESKSYTHCFKTKLSSYHSNVTRVIWNLANHITCFKEQGTSSHGTVLSLDQSRCLNCAWILLSCNKISMLTTKSTGMWIFHKHV